MLKKKMISFIHSFIRFSELEYNSSVFVPI